MRIFIERQNTYIDVPTAKTGRSLLKHLGLFDEDVILVRNGTVVLADTAFKEGDEIKVLSVISGG